MIQTPPLDLLVSQEESPHSVSGITFYPLKIYSGGQVEEILVPDLNLELWELSNQNLLLSKKSSATFS